MSEYEPNYDQAAFQDAAQEQLDEAVTQRQQQRQQAEPEQKQPEPPQTTIRRRTDNLRAALGKAKVRDHVVLPELSRNSPMGEEVRLRVRRLTVQELAASGTLPTRADSLVTKLVDTSMQMTEGPRNEMGLGRETDENGRLDIDQTIKDLYGGWTREAVAAFFEFQCAVCCAAVVDEDYRLYMTYEEVMADPERGVLVWDIPDMDRETIFEWVLAQERNAESSVMPFRRARNARHAAQSESGAELPTE